MTIAVFFHPDCLLHEAGIGHPEQPDRVRIIQQSLMRFTSKPIDIYDAPLATYEQLIAAHDQAYVDWLIAHAPKEGFVAIDADTMMNPYSYQAALRAAGAVVAAVDLVMKNDEVAVFCNVRPPGHHAEHDKAMGFCFFNNVAVGAYHAMNHYDISRIAIIDFDVHHGNGTQDIFQNDTRVLYCSSFEHPFYPGYNSEDDNEHILNVPLPAGTASKTFREQVSAAWFSKVEAFKPQIIFFSAGFDAHSKDPLAELNLTQADYVWITKAISKIAREHNAKLISVLEGGYNLDVLAKCVPAHVEAMLR